MSVAMATAARIVYAHIVKEPGYCGANSSVEFGSIFLCNASDPGLVVFPTHRRVKARKVVYASRRLVGRWNGYRAGDL